MMPIQSCAVRSVDRAWRDRLLSLLIALQRRVNHGARHSSLARLRPGFTTGCAPQARKRIRSAGRRVRGARMTDQAKVARIARQIFEGHERRRRFERLRGELACASLDEAYDVQDEVHRLFKEAGWGELTGHKIALTSKAVQELCGVDQPA